MKQFHSHDHIRALTFSLLFLLSCSAQDKTRVQEGSASTPADSAVELSELSGEAKPLQQEPNVDEQISPFVRRIFQDRRGNFWFGTNGDGVCRYDGKSLDYYRIQDGFGGRAVRAIVGDKEGNLWFGTDGGVTRYEGGAFTNYTEDDGLSSNNVWSMCIDRAGTIWVGTFGGACRFDATSGGFTSFPLPPAPTLDALRGVTSLNIVHSIMEDRAGHMWFAVGAGGVYKYDGNSFIIISEKDGLCDNSVNCILEAKDGDLWFATHYKGVCRYDGTSFTNVTETEGLSGTEVWDVYEDKSGNIWFPSEGFGVYRYDGETFSNFSKEDGLASHAIQCTFEDKDGRLWFGGWLGAYRYDGNSLVNVTREGPWQ